MSISVILMTIVTVLLAAVIAKLFQEGYRLQGILWIAAMLVIAGAIAWVFLVMNGNPWSSRS